jgi:hypothetical protein
MFQASNVEIVLYCYWGLMKLWQSRLYHFNLESKRFACQTVHKLQGLFSYQVVAESDHIMVQ